MQLLKTIFSFFKNKKANMSTRTLPPITEEKALKAYKNSNAEIQRFLENYHGKEVFNQKITDIVKTLDDANRIAGVRGNDDEITIIARALNEDWEPNYGNSNEYKYFPVFKWVPGSGFVLCDVRYDGTLAVVGARRVYKTEELARYAGTQFIKEYNRFLSL
jgi:hypothetical protein